MTNLRVLLADSDTSFRTNAQSALTRQGYLVIPAATGQDALTLLAADEIDVVVTDVGLPQLDGLDILRAAKAKSPSMPVILIAEPGSVASATAGVSEGASNYLVKPLDDFTGLVGLIDRAAGEPASKPPQTPPDNPAADSSAGQEAAARLLDAATSGQDLGQFLSVYAEAVAQLSRAPHALVLLSHGDGQLHLTGVHGFADRAEAGRAFVRTGGEEFAYHVAAARDTLDQAAPVTGVETIKPKIQELVGFPLMYARDVLGVAVLFLTGESERWPSAAVEVMRRLTQQAALVVELSRVRELAARRNPTDVVTGLYNREHFFELAEREFRRSWRFGERIAAVQLDVDEIDKLRHLLGPAETDELMRQVARSIYSHVRNIDVVGRLDADKLGVLLLNATREFAMEVAERLRRAVAEIELSTTEGTWQVTASLGVAVYPREQCASVHDLVGLAAQATRAAKRAGHNRVVGV